jgi:ribosomal protein S18 acetylase RimI-like enzyme
MIQSREYRGEADYQRVRELLIESYAITGTMHNWGVDCWDWFRYNGRVFEEIANARSWEREVRLWEEDGAKLVGVAIPDGGDVFLQVHPHYRHVENEMLGWAERHYQASRPSGADRWSLSVYVYEYDQERQALLEGRGYKNLGQDSYMRRRSFDKPIPEFGLPRGYAIRSLAGKDREDLERRAAIANNAFNITKHTAETIQVLQRAPTYRPELDLVVVGTDGMFVAYCVIWFDEANRIGMFGPVGTHRAYRRLGLGKAMMSEGLMRLQALKVRMAYVDCDLDEAANRLYESVGFTDYDGVYHWQKEF